MNDNCTEIDDLLMAGDPASLAAAARHAEGCPGCMETLREWNEISETASSMKASWPSDLLWPRIERSLREERKKARTSRVLQWAAVLALTAGLTGTAWYSGLRQARTEAEYEKAILRTSRIEAVERAERAHIEAIAELEKEAEVALEQADEPLMISYKEKLMLLDDAIAECQTAIDQNRNNAHLRKQLLTMYTEKQRTLNDVLREGRNATNQ